MHRYIFEIEDAAVRAMRHSKKKGEIIKRAHQVFDRTIRLPNRPELYLPAIHPRDNSFTFSFSRELSVSELEGIAGEGVNVVLYNFGASEPDGVKTNSRQRS